MNHLYEWFFHRSGRIIMNAKSIYRQVTHLETKMVFAYLIECDGSQIIILSVYNMQLATAVKCWKSLEMHIEKAWMYYCTCIGVNIDNYIIARWN